MFRLCFSTLSVCLFHILVFVPHFPPPFFSERIRFVRHGCGTLTLLCLMTTARLDNDPWGSPVNVQRQKQDQRQSNHAKRSRLRAYYLTVCTQGFIQPSHRYCRDQLICSRGLLRAKPLTSTRRDPGFGCNTCPQGSAMRKLHRILYDVPLFARAEGHKNRAGRARRKVYKGVLLRGVSTPTLS